MAIQSNRRKRKHEQTTTDHQDDGEEVVPKKVPKEGATTTEEAAGTLDSTEMQVEEQDPQVAGPSKKKHKKKTQDINGDEAEVSPDSGIEPEQEQQMRFPNDFKMLNFRSKLQGNNFITELRHFLYMCEIRPKIVAKYIEKRGKPLELAEAFNRIDKSNVLHLGYLCEALQRIIMEILTNQKSHMESAAHAARYFLKSHGQVLEQLLQSAQPNHRRNALKLLTAIVCVDAQLGRQVLSSYDILSNLQTMEDMLSHSKNDYKQPETVRKAYIHFVLAFLVDNNTLLIRNILDRAQLIRVLAKGLVFDDHVTVCVVLNALRQYVLENPNILKTKKVYVFDLVCCKYLRQLYNWHGPEGLVQLYSKAGKPTYQPQRSPEAEAVATAAHQLLLLLFTSRKHGISFDAMSSYRLKHNKLQGQLLGSLHRPYADPMQTELILKTLEACPDLVRNTVRNYAIYVNPVRVSGPDLPKALELLSRIILSVPPGLLGGSLDKLTLTDFSYWIKEHCLPLEALLHITGKYMLKRKEFPARLAVNRLLLAMMTQYSNYMTAVNQREQSKRAGNSLRRFKFDLLNHLLTNFPTIESILYSLYLSIQDQGQEGVDVLQHLSVTLDLVLLMCKENRAFVNKTSQILDYLDVLRPLYETNFDTPGAQPVADLMQLELKSIKTILLLFPRALQPQEPLFGKVLRSFIRAYLLSDAALKLEAGELLQRLFHNTGMFEGCSYEVDIWLEALVGFDGATVEQVSSILLSVLSLDISEVEQQELPALDVSEAVHQRQDLRKLFNQIEQGQTVQAYVDTLTLSKMMPLLLQGVELSAPYDAYVELVCVLLYHYHSKPGKVQQLYGTQLEQHADYMQQSKISELPANIAQHWPLLAQLQQTLLQAQPSLSFEQVFAWQEQAEEQLPAFELQLEQAQFLPLHGSLSNARRNMIYVHAVMYLLQQLMQQQQLSAGQAQSMADFLIRLLQIAQQLDDAQAQQSGVKLELEQEQGQELDITHTQRLLHYVYALRLSQLPATQLLSVTSATQLNYVRFLRRLSAHCRQLPKFVSYTAYFRLQLLKALEMALATDVKQLAQEQLLEVVALMENFDLNAEECAHMLQLLCQKLQAHDYEQLPHYFELLLLLLRRLAMLPEAVVDCQAALVKLQLYYQHFTQAGGGALSEAQLEQLESALLQFLSQQHHHLASCTSDFFNCLLNQSSGRKLSKPGIQLSCLLLQRLPQLSANVKEQLEQKELMYALLHVAFDCKYVLEASLLQRCYQGYKSGILKSIEKPQKAALIYREHAEASAQLLAKCMPKSECVDYTQKQLKFDAVELFQLRVLREIYEQAYAAASEQQQANIFSNYVQLNVQMLGLDLKKQSVQLGKLQQLAYNCYSWWQQHQQPEALDWSRVLNGAHWLNFCRSCLKQALQLSEQPEQQQQADQVNGLLLKLMAYLCEQLYEDYQEEHAGAQQEQAALLYELICTHSCCYEQLLGEASDVKTHILQLLEVLARKAPSALQAAHIPVILGSYQARLSAADRYALALLEHYERFEVNLAQYRPFIWGESAVAHYALRAADPDERSKLQQQETNIAQVLALIAPTVCQYTIENFPIWRALQSSQQLPTCEFHAPALAAQRFGDNSLEQQLESGVTVFDQQLRRLCPKREQLYEQCYDPAFMLPLMLHCFAPESVVRAQWPVQNGLLALSFCALSSLDKNMRLAAACCQQRYRTHFELAKFYEKPLWTQAYDNIQSGLSNLRRSWLAQRRSHGGTPRVPLIPALFIAHSFNLSTDPTHLLYKRLMMYLQLKQSFDFQTIPEFNVFFYSQEPEHQQYREFIIEVLRCGIKCSADLFLLVSTNTFKVLLSFYNSSLATLETNLLLLSVLSTCVKIPGAVRIMLEHVGVLSWLSGVIRDTQFHQFDIIEGVLSILNNLYYAVAASQAELPDYAHVQLRLQRLVLQLLPLLSPRVSVPALARLLNVLQKTATAGQYQALSASQLDQLLDCVARHWPTELAGIRYVRQFGGRFASPRSEYCNWLAQEQQLDTHAVLALSSLRQYTCDWWEANQASNTSIEPAALLPIEPSLDDTKIVGIF
ncbi:CG12499 [Drosophila busckii]|uniref:CG12499 n=1 Tax=Drosophila busckii TaxID=30019 RepID=A0A0M4ERQ8_DROBS|nr:uncharacterized protein LOC108603980 [Drosophila busckii]ALC47247.1 CG12499 [Drosophila busckii]